MIHCADHHDVDILVVQNSPVVLKGVDHEWTLGHAVLIVFFKHPKNGQILNLLLDNQIKSIANADNVRHYQPVFSINKYFWWRHHPVTG